METVAMYERKTERILSRWKARKSTLHRLPEFQISPIFFWTQIHFPRSSE